MIRKIFCLVFLGIFSAVCAGCSLIPLAISAAASYGIYQATK